MVCPITQGDHNKGPNMLPSGIPLNTLISVLHSRLHIVSYYTESLLSTILSLCLYYMSLICVVIFGEGQYQMPWQNQYIYYI